MSLCRRSCGVHPPAPVIFNPPQEDTMKASIVTTLAAATVALGALGPSAVRAQAHTDHVMVVPGELTWADAPAVAPGEIGRAHV